MDDQMAPQGRMMRFSGRLFMQVEHGVYWAVGGLLGIAAIGALIEAAMELVQGMMSRGSGGIFTVVDQLLYVLMLVEILHTVRVSIRSGSLTAEPFLIVGLIASIRRVLVITLESSRASGGQSQPVPEDLFRTSMIELGVLAGLILVMVFSIFLLRRMRATAEEEA